MARERFFTMTAFVTSYLNKCQDFFCDPVHVLLREIQECQLKSEQFTSIKLNGNRKELFNKRVTYLQVFALTEALERYPLITSIDLSYNIIGSAGVMSIATLLQRRGTALRYLNLEGNDIGPQGAICLATALSRKAPAPQNGIEREDEDEDEVHGLLQLNMRGNPIDEDGGLSMADMLQVNTKLQDLNLGDTEIGTRSVVAIATALNYYNSSLRRINLENPRLFSLQEEVAWHLGKLLDGNRALNELKIGKFRIRDPSLDTLVSYGVVNNSTLTTLDLRCNEITEVGGAYIGRMLSENFSITSLNLSCNRLADRGVQGLTRALTTNKSLKRLDLSYNYIGDDGLLSLADALSQNRKITELRIWGNYPGQISSKALVDLLKERRIAHLETDFKPYIIDGIIYMAKLYYDP